MTKLIKMIGLLFLPVAAVVLIVTMFNARLGKGTKNIFIQEYDEQDIYG